MQAPKATSIAFVAKRYIVEVNRLTPLEPDLLDMIFSFFGRDIFNAVLNSKELAEKVGKSSGEVTDITQWDDELVKIESRIKRSSKQDLRNTGLAAVAWINNIQELVVYTRQQIEKVLSENRVKKDNSDLPASKNKDELTRPEIIKLQEFITKLGYSTSMIDGIYGPATQSAILNYKKDRNLPATLDIDEKLLARIEREANGNTEKRETDETGPRSSRKKSVKKANPQPRPDKNELLESKPAYWLHKLDMNKDAVASLMVGQSIVVDSTTEFNHETRILGLVVNNLQAIICLLTRGRMPANTLGGDILTSLRVAEIFEPPISMLKIKDIIGPIISKNPKDEFIQISEEIYNTILQNREQPPVARKSYRATLTTEGNHAETDDKLEFDNDITSLASVISLKDVKPPLAIGLFGNWGSGKSFFMEKLSGKIDEFTQSDSEGMVKNVVQVKFNSWHYSDANLWASLITEIFDSLHDYATRNDKEEDLQKLSQTLHITGLQKEEAEKKKQQLEERIQHLKQKQDEKRRRLEDVSGISLLKLVLSDTLIKKDLQELNNDNIEKLVNDKVKIDGYITEVKGTWNQLQYIARSFSDMKGGRWVFVITIALVAFFVPVFLKFQGVSDYWKHLSFGTAAFMSAVVTFLAQLLKTVRPALAAIKTTVERLRHLKNTIDARKTENNSNLSSAELELRELTDALEHIDARIKETKQEIAEIKSGKRLLEFIQNRSKDESYARQLGLISWIRKDFKRLDDLLRKQHTLNTDEKQKLCSEDIKLQIDRIILYIDDLDRCKEDVVVKVLEAVHLLLAFPLFVVVVGVDPRWLNNALAKQYEAMFKNNSGNGGNHHQHKHVATTYDYLEKIFQVPFALKPINKTGQGDLVAYLLRNEMEIEKNTSRKEPMEGGSAAFEDNIDVITEAGVVFKDGSLLDTVDISSDSLQKNIDVAKAKEEQPLKEVQTVVAPEKLKFSKDELNCMQRMSLIYGHTPRGINRYVNIYRIIKSHPGLKKVGEYDEDEFVPILFTLAIVVGYPAEAKKFIDEMTKAKDEELLSEILAKVGRVKSLQDIVKQCLSEAELNMPAEPFKRNLELISRFSFRTIMC